MIKRSTEQSYRQRLNSVIAYLHENLDQDVRVEDLAQVANFSPCHWHRIYTAMQGETIAATVKRLRLERAADQLANHSTPVKEVATMARYSTPESFSKAFKAAYDQSPVAYRESGSHTAFKLAQMLNDNEKFEVVVEPLDVRNCASVSHTGSYMQINQAMAQLFGELASQQLLSDRTRMMAVFHDDPEMTPTESLRSAACSPVAARTALNAPLEALELYQGNYAKLLYQGPYADMKDAYQWLYGTWLPQSGFEVADAPNVEEYLNNPQEVAPGELLTRLSMPLLSSSSEQGA